MRDVNDHRLEELILEAPGYVLVAFLAQGSIPCDNFRPDFVAVEVLLEGQEVECCWIDAAENPSLTEFLQVTAVPTTLLFKDGDERGRWEGPYSTVALRERIAKAMLLRKDDGS